MPLRGSVGRCGTTHGFCLTGWFSSTEAGRKITPGKTQGNIQGEEVGVGGSLFRNRSAWQAAHLTLPGRQKEKTVLGWGRSQSLSQQQFKSQVPGVKSQTQIGKAVSARKKEKTEMKLPKVFPREQPLPALWHANFVHISLGLRSQHFHPVSRRITWEGVCGHIFRHRRGPGSRVLRPVRRSCSCLFGSHWPQSRGGWQSLGWGGLRSGGVRKHQD